MSYHQAPGSAFYIPSDGATVAGVSWNPASGASGALGILIPLPPSTGSNVSLERTNCVADPCLSSSSSPYEATEDCTLLKSSPTVLASTRLRKVDETLCAPTKSTSNTSINDHSLVSTCMITNTYYLKTI